MTRDLKFRAWDEELKLMLETIDLSQPLQYYKWLGRGDRPIMQYTGLKDKNGVEIYEGDILEFYKKETNDAEMKPIREIVRWRTQEYDPYSMHEGEIIGNIYQNPELLNNKDK